MEPKPRRIKAMVHLGADAATHLMALEISYHRIGDSSHDLGKCRLSNEILLLGVFELPQIIIIRLYVAYENVNR